MGMGVHGEPCPGGPVPRGCMPAKAQASLCLGEFVCVCVCVCVYASLHNSVSVSVCRAGSPGFLCVSGCGGCVPELKGVGQGWGAARKPCQCTDGCVFRCWAECVADLVSPGDGVSQGECVM